VAGVQIAIAANADAETLRWFPHLQAGIEGGLELAAERGRALTALRVEIQKIHAHPTDTTEIGCERYGRAFALDLLVANSKQIE
jgi:hypothetical protein